MTNQIRIIKPQPGPQTDFLASSADIVIYGGAAGGGKTYALLLHSLSVASVKSASVIFRKTSPEITQEGGLWDVANELYFHCGAQSKQNPERTFDFPGGGSVTFAHMQHEKDKFKQQGAQIPCICFDELTHFSEAQFTYMLSRNRDPKGLIHPHVRATCNPDPDSWVAKFLSWWIGEDGFPIPERAGKIRYFCKIAGEIQWADNPQILIDKFGSAQEDDEDKIEPKSVAFIPASTKDNQINLKNNPGYISSLKALDEVEKARLLFGNWKIKRQGKLFMNPKFAWDHRYDTTAWVDTAFGGGNNTTLCIGYQVGEDFFVRGYSWKESVTRLYSEMARLCKQDHCGTVTFESNADKGASAESFRKFWDSVEDYNERENKHNKIMVYAVRPWEQGRVYIHPETNQTPAGRQWLNNLLAYEEEVEPDDEADGLASWLRKKIKSQGVFFSAGNRE